MNLKEQICQELEEHRGEFLSGSELAKRFQVSRNAVWKAIKSLEKEGYEVEAVTRRGYRLKEENDVLAEAQIREAMGDMAKGVTIQVMKSVDSTNTELKRQALSGASDQTVLFAEEQTQGKGRRGRSFYSPYGTGIYMSILLRPQVDGRDAVLVTTATAVAVSLAIEEVFACQTTIKWVNDVYYRDKKLCGILTEGISDLESGEVDVMIVGIGMNYKTKDFPEEIREFATSLDPESHVPRNVLAGAVLKHFFKIYQTLSTRDFIQEYKKRSNVLGEEIVYQEAGVTKRALAVDIDRDGGLVVEEIGDLPVRRTLTTGEITVRVKKK